MGDEIKMAEDDDNKSFLDEELYKTIQAKEIPRPVYYDSRNDLYFNALFVARSRGVENNNVFHVAAQYANSNFIEKALDHTYFYGRYDLLFGQNWKGEIPLHLAARSGDKKTVKTLLLPASCSLGDHEHMRDSYLCMTDKQGDTPLHTALRYGHQNIAIMLVRRKVNLAYMDNEAGESPAYLAALNLCERFLHTILDAQKYDQSLVSFSGPFGMTVFHPARYLNDDIMLALVETRKELLKHRDNKGKTVLHYAVEDAIEPMVGVLLKADSSLAFLHDDDGMTPLHRASSMGCFSIVRTILKVCTQSISVICDKGVHAGQTPLHVAKMDACFLRVCLQHTSMKMLVNVVDNQGNTPLHLAFKQNSWAQDVANAILEVKGINWRLQNKEGYTPMDLCKYDNTANLVVSKESMNGDLVEKTIDNIPSNLKPLKPEEINLEPKYLFDFTSYRGVEIESVVHSDAMEGDMKIFNSASWYGINETRVLVLSGLNSKAETPLHVAAAAGKIQVVESILKLSRSCDKFGELNDDDEEEEEEQVAVVIETTNPPPNHDQDDNRREMNSKVGLEPWKMKSSRGDTPLHCALRNGHEEVAMRLLEWDPSLVYSSVNKMNESPLYLASLTACSKVVQHLLTESRYSEDKQISTGGPDGQNALHAAVRRPRETLTADVLSKVPSFNYDKSGLDKPDGFHHIQLDSVDATTKYLMEYNSSLLTEVDNDGKSPLHYAVELDNFYVWYPCIQFSLIHTSEALLMHDNEGFTPLLKAAANGSVLCVLAILGCCGISTAEVRHAGNDSTVLHLFKATSANTLELWLDVMKRFPKLKIFINEIDKDGNTPLHYAILESDIKKTRFLLSIDGVRLSIQNKSHQTPIDLCTQLLTKGDPRHLAIWIALEDFLAKEKKRRNTVPLLLRINTRVMTSFSDLRMSSDEDLKKLLENVAVAAALLITLSFAATFTIPGGYNGDTGQALRMKEVSVKTFVASNVVAMLLGVGALLTYTFGATKKAWLRVLSIPCVVMLQCALLATIISFISGVYALVFQDAKWIATLAVVIVGGVLLLFSISPAAAGALIQILKWFRKCLQRLVRGGKIVILRLLTAIYPLAQRYGLESNVDRLGETVGNSITQM